MKLTIDFCEFKPWSGATETWDKIYEAEKVDQLETILEDTYPEGMSTTELNDLLWFEPETVYKWLGIKEDGNKEEDNDIDTFDSFCSHFTACELCPLRNLDDCQDIYNKNIDKYLAMIDSCPHDHIITDYIKE